MKVGRTSPNLSCTGDEHAVLTDSERDGDSGRVLSATCRRLCYFCDATNLYGPGDNVDLQKSHVLPALIRKFHEAKEAGASSVTVWGTGSPRREFLHVDDLADACVHLMRDYSSPDIVNVGWGRDISIAELAGLIRKIVGYEGDIQFDTSKPDGTPRKLLDTTRLTALGWQPSIELEEGIAQTYKWYCEPH